MVSCNKLNRYKILCYISTFIMIFVLTLSINIQKTYANAENGPDPYVSEKYNPDLIDPGIESSGNMNELGDKISDKLYEVIAMVQKVAVPLCIIFFIISAFSVITGSGGKNGFMGGIIGMGVSALALVGILYAKEIVEFITVWVAN